MDGRKGPSKSQVLSLLPELVNLGNPLPESWAGQLCSSRSLTHSTAILPPLQEQHEDCTLLPSLHVIITFIHIAIQVVSWAEASLHPGGWTNTDQKASPRGKVYTQPWQEF